MSRREGKITNRKRPQENFTMIRNGAILDASLSLKALGLLALMLQKPSGWVYHLSQLQQHKTDGRDSFRSALNELIAAGYVRAVQARATGGRFGATDYEVCDEQFGEKPEPAAKTEPTVTGKPVHGDTVNGKTVDGKTVYGETVDGKPDTSKTDSTKTDLSKTEIKKNTSEIATQPGTALAPAAPRERINYQGFLDSYNDLRGVLPEAMALNESRRAGLRRFLKDVPPGADPRLIFADAVRQIAGDAFYIERKYNLDTLLAKAGRVIQRAEQFRAQKTKSSGHLDQYKELGL